jgi:broad specificity phosphatase PhoE
LVFSSDLIRCKKTTDIISKKLGAKVKYSSLLREKDDGEWIGRKSDSIDWDSLGGTFEDRKAPRGESLSEVLQRGKDFFRLLEKNKELSDKKLLIVSHGTFLRLILGHFLGLNIKDSVFNFSIDNCSITTFVLKDGGDRKYKFKSINDVSHLNN